MRVVVQEVGYEALTQCETLGTKLAHRAIGVRLMQSVVVQISGATRSISLRASLEDRQHFLHHETPYAGARRPLRLRDGLRCGSKTPRTNPRHECRSGKLGADEIAGEAEDEVISALTVDLQFCAVDLCRAW